MTAQRCWDCNNTFYSSSGGLYCNVCYQGRETRKRAERQAQQDRWEAERHQRIQAQHTQALINAEHQRINAINHQTQIIMESRIKSKDAYDRGYNYVDTEYAYSNPAGVKLWVDEDGDLRATWNQLYTTPMLNAEFHRGISAKVHSYKSVFDTLKSSAKLTGQLNAEGTFPTKFTLYTGLEVGGKKVNTESFNSQLIRTINEETGELTMTWNEPFSNSALNQSYKDGVNEVYWKENTDDKKFHRLEVDVPEIQAKRKLVRKMHRLDKLFRISVYAIPVLFFLLIWQITTGWTTFFMFIEQ
jgi:uncharacterized Zn finger protein (UPF0148 family)